jgi:chromosome segregation ATPase
MGCVAADEAASLLAHAAALERRDELVARELDTARGLAERAGAVRSRAAEVRAALRHIPGELEGLGRRRHEAEDDAARARVELERAESRLAELEAGRRRRGDEIERARRELSTARADAYDADTRLERLAEQAAELRAEQVSLEAEAEQLVRAASDVASDIRCFERVTEAARREPGATLDELEDWGGQVRSALFVARGTLETERERIVVEANALGAAVLGETLGASSVAVVRRRLEAHLA